MRKMQQSIRDAGAQWHHGRVSVLPQHEAGEAAFGVLRERDDRFRRGEVDPGGGVRHVRRSAGAGGVLARLVAKPNRPSPASEASFAKKLVYLALFVAGVSGIAPLRAQ